MQSYFLVSTSKISIIYDEISFNINLKNLTRMLYFRHYEKGYIPESHPEVSNNERIN
jgi:hypothetical protein